MLLGLPFRRPYPCLSPVSLSPLYPPISLLDLSRFLLSLFQLLLLTVSLTTIFSCLGITLVYVGWVLPWELVRERWGSPYPFERKPSSLQDITFHLVRLAFQHFPHSIGRCFFSEAACLPMMVDFIGGDGGKAEFDRHCVKVEEDGVRGWWISPGKAKEVEGEGGWDVVLVYFHGGGLTMGSPAFYLPFLLSLTSELLHLGISKPAIFAPEYSLAPEERFPTQLEEAERAWRWVTSKVGGQGRVGLGGDSAGAGVAMGLMFKLAEKGREEASRPDFVSLLSPWTSMLHPPPLDSPLLKSDFVSPPALQHFSHLYSSAQPRSRHPTLATYLVHLLSPSAVRSFDGPDVEALHRAMCLKWPLLSPEDVEDGEWWERAVPSSVYVAYGAGEVLRPQCVALAERFRRVLDGRGWVREREWELCHAPSMVWCYLGRDTLERRKGVRDMAELIAEACS